MNQFRRGPIVLLAILVLGAFAAYQSAEYVIRGDLAGLAYAGMGIVGVAAVVAILNNWRNGVYLFLGWLLLEDFARKFLGNNMVIYLAKDFLALVVFFSFFAAYRRKEVPGFRPPFLMPVIIFFWYGLIQVFNPASTSRWYGVLGMTLFFYFVPLLFVGYALLSSEKELRRFFTIQLIFALVVVSLGIAQSIAGPSFLNPGNLADDIRTLSTTYRVAPISGARVYRPNAIFVSAGRYADFLFVVWNLVLGFTGYLLLRQRRGRALAFVALAVIFAGIMLCASRGAFLWCTGGAIFASAAFLWGAPWQQREAIRAGRLLLRTALGIALAITVLLITYPEALKGRLAVYSETLSPSSPVSELTHRGWYYPVQNFLGAFNYDRWPYGYGIGTTALGTQYVGRIFNVQPVVVGVESGFGALVVEMGVGGLILWITMSLAILISAWKIVRRLKGSQWFPVAFAIFWYALILLLPMTFLGIQAYEDFVPNAYLWLLLGILFRLPTLAVSAQFAAATTAAASEAQRIPRRWTR